MNSATPATSGGKGKIIVISRNCIGPERLAPPMKTTEKTVAMITR